MLNSQLSLALRDVPPSGWGRKKYAVVAEGVEKCRFKQEESHTEKS